MTSTRDRGAGGRDKSSAKLPAVLTSFIGRTREIAEVNRLLPSSRLLTLTGPAGSGKTRLALRVAAVSPNVYADGIDWVELASLHDPKHVARAVAKKLNVAEERNRPVLESLADALRDKHMLLILDNCEHLVTACASLAEALLTAPRISILATSREPLGLAGEILYPVPPLTLPPLDYPAHDLEKFDAVRLFAERARAILPNFALTPANAATVTSICHRLDGIPLAIELASARVAVLTVEEIAARLDTLFALLSAPSTVGRHQTMRAALDWSFALLTPQEQKVLRRLSVFAGGCSLLAAEAVCAGDDIERAEILELLASLVNKSLVIADTLRPSEARYALLETVRQYALEALRAGPVDWSETRDRHLGYILQLVEDIQPNLEGEYQQESLNRLQGEFENVRAALARALESYRIEVGLRICNAIYQFWTIRDYVEEGLVWVTRLLAHADDRIPVVVRATALAYASMFSGFRGNAASQLRYGREAAALAESAGDAGKEALRMALAGVAWAAHAVGDHQTEFDAMQRAVVLNRELGDAHQLGISLYASGFAAMSLGRYDVARALLDESLLVLRPTGNTYRIAMALNYTGDLARCDQNYSRARAAYEESISLLREIGAARDVASALKNLGHAYLHLDDADRAHAQFAESLEIQRAQRNTPGIAECLLGFGALAIASRLPASGARLLAAAVAIGGERLVTAWAVTRLEYEYWVGLVHSRLSERELQAEQEAGRRLSLEEAIAYAQSLPLASPIAKETPTIVDALTVRESEIAALIAQGKSNGEIARQLVVSKRTVEKHIANILSKSGFTNRAQIVRWAIQSGTAKSPS